MKIITDKLFELQDEKYREFQAKLVPGVEFDNIIGIRTPDLRKYAKSLAKEEYAEEFLHELPHVYYEENNLHGMLINLMYKDFERYLEELEKFLPYIDNWATCDLMTPKIFKENLPLVYERVKIWLKSERTYTVRFAIVTMLNYYLGEAFEPEMLRMATDVKSEEYYIKMAVAWYFSMALVSQYDVALPYIKDCVLDKWTHNKAIQKAVESRQIDADTKNYLRGLKIK